MTNPFLEHFQNEVLPVLMQSHVALVIFTGGIDSKLCLEVGAAVLLNLPILAVARSESMIPVSVRYIAAKCLVLDDDWNSESSKAKIQAAVTELVK